MTLTTAITIPLALAVAGAIMLRTGDVPLPHPDPRGYDCCREYLRGYDCCREYYEVTFDALPVRPVVRPGPAWFNGSFGSLEIDLIPQAPVVAKGK